MKKNLFCALILLFMVVFFLFNTEANTGSPGIQSYAISHEDIPEGYVYGVIPEKVKTTLKNNPWLLDRNAITVLTRKMIYPEADPASIKNIHMSILARSSRPYSDDIVCYIIEFNNKNSAAKENLKLGTFVKNNSDRALMFESETVSVFLHADDIKDFPNLGKIAGVIKTKMGLSDEK